LPQIFLLFGYLYILFIYVNKIIYNLIIKIKKYVKTYMGIGDWGLGNGGLGVGGGGRRPKPHAPHPKTQKPTPRDYNYFYFK